MQDARGADRARREREQAEEAVRPCRESVPGRRNLARHLLRRRFNDYPAIVVLGAGAFTSCRDTLEYMSALRLRLYPFLLLLAVAGLLVLVLRFSRNDDARAVQGIVAPAAEICSGAGATGDAQPCEAHVDAAKPYCATLSATARPLCESQLDVLNAAAQEAVHQARGVCDQMTTEAAASACRVVRIFAFPTPTAVPVNAASQDSQSEESGPSAGPVVAGVLWACAVVEAEDICEGVLGGAEKIATLWQ
jgi:hypothetical protein